MTANAREVAEQVFRQLPVRDPGAFADAMAEDGVLEIPFTIPGMPDRLTGREQIREHLAQRWSRTPDIEVHGIYPQIYETTDPEVVIVENEVDLTIAGKRTRTRTSVNVIRVRDGKMVLFRDYMNTARFASIAAAQDSSR